MEKIQKMYKRYTGRISTHCHIIAISEPERK